MPLLARADVGRLWLPLVRVASRWLATSGGGCTAPAGSALTGRFAPNRERFPPSDLGSIDRSVPRDSASTTTPRKLTRSWTGKEALADAGRFIAPLVGTEFSCRLARPGSTVPSVVARRSNPCDALSMSATAASAAVSDSSTPLDVSRPCVKLGGLALPFSERTIAFIAAFASASAVRAFSASAACCLRLYSASCFVSCDSATWNFRRRFFRRKARAAGPCASTISSTCSPALTLSCLRFGL
mmetsp:Transcript_892/g.2757  ORF Transcript_892/g.2757 Transcript_892/m.2757 type:complete len:242 (-) Transcript_892:126-851(-)